MTKSLLLAALLLMPLMASADAPAAVPVCKGSQGYADAFEGRRTFLLRPDRLAATKARGDKNAAWEQLFVRADKALAGPTYSVVDKTPCRRAVTGTTT
jgi:opacity protein-like surface antigen